MTAPAEPDVRLLRLLYAYDREAALDGGEQLLEERGGLLASRFELTSTHGRRVRGRLWEPPGRGAALPLVVLVGEAGDCFGGVARLGPEFAQRGIACAAIETAVADAAAPLLPWSLRERVIQASVDLRRCLDLLESRPAIDAGRAGVVGFGAGAFAATAAMAFDARVRASALLGCGSGLLRRLAALPDEQAARDLEQVGQMVEPQVFASLIASRPLLLVNGLQDEIIPPESARRLFAALPEPKRLLWYEGGRPEPGGRELDETFDFLCRSLRE